MTLQTEPRCAIMFMSPILQALTSRHLISFLAEGKALASIWVPATGTRSARLFPLSRPSAAATFLLSRVPVGWEIHRSSLPTPGSDRRCCSGDQPDLMSELLCEPLGIGTREGAKNRFASMLAGTAEKQNSHERCATRVREGQVIPRFRGR